MNTENDKITAEWARKTSSEILGDKVKSQIDTCLLEIKRAVSRNESSTNIGIYAESLTIQELRKRGFNCDQHSDQRDGSYLYIKW